jgi:transposase InsO family protein
VFTVIDRNTRWFEALPLSDISAKSCAAVLTQGCIGRYGVPTVITSDRGSQFTSALWDSLCTILGIWHVQTTAYHPQSNGLVENIRPKLRATNTFYFLSFSDRPLKSYDASTLHPLDVNSGSHLARVGAVLWIRTSFDRIRPMKTSGSGY